MSTVVALNKQAHGAIKVDTQQVGAAGADLHLVPVVMSEFRKLIVHYPITFSKNAETGQFMCSAVMGFEAGENLFWHHTGWQGVYIPLQITRQPFFLGQDGAGANGDEIVLCINEDSPLISEDRGEALFDDCGNPSSYLQQQQQQLSQLFHGERQTAAFVAAVLELDLLTAMTLKIDFADQSSTAVNGLYTIDEDKLAKLSGDQLRQLQQAEHLAAIYAMIHSTAQIYSLIDKKNQRLQTAKDWFAARP